MTNELVQNTAQQKTLDSREVAKMVGKEHKTLMRDIRTYMEHLAGYKSVPSSYFNESSYIDLNNMTRKCYLITKKGCELIATRMQGAKGTQFAMAYIEKFNEMEETIKEVSNVLTEEQKLQLAIFNAKDKESAVLASAELDRYRQNQLALQKPKTDYYDIVMDSQFLSKASDIAAKFDLSAIKLNKILHNLEIIYKKGSTWYLYQDYKGNDYVVYPESEYSPQMKWTKKGVKFIIDLLLEKGYKLNNLNK